MSLATIQKKIEKEYTRAIRLEKTKRKRKETLQEFLIMFFTVWCKEKQTVYVDNKEVQTGLKGNHGVPRRSLGDIYMLCKYYYPDVTLKEVVYELYVGLKEHFNKGYRTSWCNFIQKRVWYFDETRPNLFFDKTKNDEYGKPYRFYLAEVAGKEKAKEEGNQDEEHHGAIAAIKPNPPLPVIEDYDEDDEDHEDGEWCDMCDCYH